MPVTFEKTTAVDASADELWAYHAQPGALARLTPPFERVRNSVEVTALTNGARAVVEVGVGPIWTRFVAEHSDVVEGRGFTDTMIEGPFKSFRHEHVFEDGKLTDRLTVEPPVTDAADGVVERRLARIFTHRHKTTALDVALAKRFPSRPLVVGVTGASGIVGTELRALLSVLGHTVVTIGRPPLFTATCQRLDAIVHLGGEPIAGGRLDDAHLERVRASRVEGTRALIEAWRAGRIEGVPFDDSVPRAFVSASAVGYYGDRGDDVLDDDALCGLDLPKERAGARILAEVCRGWEQAALSAESVSVRAIALRVGIVMTPAGGALGKMLPAFKAGGGARLGDGKQWMALLSVDEVAAMFYRAIVDDTLGARSSDAQSSGAQSSGARGAFNAVGVEPLTNADFTSLVGRILHRPAVLAIPRIAARALFGRAADEAYLASQRAVPTALTSSRHPFRHASAEAALRHVLGR